MLSRADARSALDLFTGTTRVAFEFKSRSAWVTAVDTARYSEVFGQCYIETDSAETDADELHEAIARLNRVDGKAGYFTETFCIRSRYFRPENGARIDAIRDILDIEYRGTSLFPILLTSLMEAADRVDSTTGLQMAYLKDWAPRAFNPLELRVPPLLPGTGRVIRDNARAVVASLAQVDLAYLDPPYNQHRYFTNYHIWETLVGWDAPETYGVACKRIDARSPHTKSDFNSKPEMPRALEQVVRDVRASIVILSYNNESWVSLDSLQDWMTTHGHVVTLAFDSKRYVGAQIGIHNASGQRVGSVSHLRNLEYLIVAGDRSTVDYMTAPYVGSGMSSQPELFAPTAG